MKTNLTTNKVLRIFAVFYNDSEPSTNYNSPKSEELDTIQFSHTCMENKLGLRSKSHNTLIKCSIHQSGFFKLFRMKINRML